MKRFYVFSVVALAIIAALASCSDDPQVPLQDKDGAVFLANGKYIDATTDFSEDELLTALCSRKWDIQGMPYIYDIYNCQQTYYEPDVYAFTELPVWQFNADGTYIDYIHVFQGGTFEIEGNKLTLFPSGRPYAPGILTTTTYTVAGFAAEYIVLDKDYTDGACYIPEGFMSFDEDVAKIRYMWNAKSKYF